MADGILKVGTITTSSGSGTITLGQSGETISIPSGATLTNSGTATGFGSLVKLDATTVSSNVANVDFTTQFTSTYDIYKIIIQGARPDTDNNAIGMRFGTGSSFDSGSNYERVVIARGS